MRLNPTIVSVYGAMGHGAEEIRRYRDAGRLDDATAIDPDE